MRITFLLLCLLTVYLTVIPQPVFAQNPFIAKPKSETHRMTTHSAAGNPFLSMIALWQHRLNRKMADLMREAKATNSLKPLAFLLVIAFAYGVIHAAGPGHGKLFAISYILAQRPGLLRGILFGNFMALFHGLSGILFVLIIRIILQKSITGTLEDVTRITQIISFSLITCLGLSILIKSIYKWIKSAKTSRPSFDKSNKRYLNSSLLPALVVGMIPCPGVVMVMLFALSMNLVGLGIMLGVTLSLGMAFTITGVVVMGILGKTASLGMVAGNGGLVITLEYLIETIAGLMITCLGLLFLTTII